MKKKIKIHALLLLCVFFAVVVFGFNFEVMAQTLAEPSAISAHDVAPPLEPSLTSFLNRYFDQSHSSFFPKSVGSIVDVQSQFPILWWDLLILDSKEKKAPDWEKIQSQCQEFARLNDAHIAKIFCGTSLADLARQAPVLSEWAHDYPLRHHRPSDQELASTMNASLAKATLPVGDLIKILRNDPYGSMTELQNLVRGDLKLHLESRGGFFYDSVTQRVLIPVQFNFPAPQTEKSAAVMAHASSLFCPGGAESKSAKSSAGTDATAGASVADDCRVATLIGAHAATLENESRVKSDLHSVSFLSALLLIGVVAFICATKRWRLLLIVPPIFLAISLAAILTVLVFGKIHGLTLAFGPGIVGLAMDYGLHIAFSNQPERIWKANLFGLLTTVIVLVIMMLSQIPLLQQLMFFSTVGVTLGSWFIYLIYKKYPTLLQVRSYGIRVPEHPAFSWAIVLLVMLSLLGLGRLHLNLDMRQLGYQSPLTAELNDWAYKSAGFQSPLLQVFAGNDSPTAYPPKGNPENNLENSSGGLNQRSLALAHEQRNWALSQHIQINTIANLLPEAATQTENLATWTEYKCSQATLGQSKWFQSLAGETQKFYAPFFNAVPCGGLSINNLLKSPMASATGAGVDGDSSAIKVPAYLRDFGNGKEWLTLWMPETETQTQVIKAKYPGVLSFVEMAMVFPRIFAAELIWMVPVSMFLAFLILVYYYRAFWLACLGVTPFFSGLGFYFGMNMIFGWNMSFISVIGLIMVFGFSLDFGIFAVDLMRREKDKPDRGIWTALTVAAFINGCGFLPLMFCHHPVLVHLGRTLLFGTIGTYFGSIWGIPGLYRFLNREKA